MARSRLAFFAFAALAAIAARAGAQETAIGAPVSLPPPPPLTPPQPAPAATPTQGSGMDVALFGGWRLATGADAEGGRFEIDAAPSLGISFAAGIARDWRVELAWSASTTRARLEPSGTAVGTDDFDLDVHVVSLGALRTFRLGRIAPFAGASLGTVVLAPGEIIQRDGARSGGSTTVRLALGATAGADMPLSRRFAVRGQARLTAPVWLSDEGLLAGGAASGFGVGAGIPMVQTEFGIGVAFTP